MKKLLLIIAVLCTSATFSQAVFDEGIQITNTESLTAPYVNVQETDGTINRIDKSTFESVQTAANYAALPATGSLTVLYITIDTGRLYRWDGSSYLGVASNATLLNGEDKAAIISGLASESDINAGGLLEFYAPDGTVWNNGKGNVDSNMSFGRRALEANTTGLFNTAYGATSLLANTEGAGNTAVGRSSMESNTVGNNNLAIGRNSLLMNVGGNQNIAIGNFNLQNSMSGDNITSVGYAAGISFSDGGGGNLVNVDEAIFIGSGTKAKADNSVNEIVVGYNAIGNGSNTATLGNTSITSTYLQGVINGNGANITNVNAATLEGFTAAQLAPSDATTSVKGVIKLAGDLGGTADAPTVIGMNAGGVLEYSSTDNTVWNNGKGDISTNTSFGDKALLSNVSGGLNTSIGNSSLALNLTGSDNTAVGEGALYRNSSGGTNTGVGSDALRYATNGSSNIAIGHSAGYKYDDGVSANLVDVNNSVYVGAFTKSGAAAPTNEIVIGYQAVGNGSNTVTIGNGNITDTYLQGNVHATNIDALIGEKGFGYYVDGLSTPTITIGTTWTQITIDALGANVTTSLPLDIRGTSELIAGSVITPIASGDDYDGRLDLTVDSKSGSPNYLQVIIDFGDSTPDTIRAYTGYIQTAKTPPFQQSLELDFFAGDTFKANGGKIYARTNIGSWTISRRNIKITRKSKKFN